MSTTDRPIISTTDLYDQYRTLWELEPGEYADRLNGLWLGLVQRTGDPAVAFHTGVASLTLETPLAGVLLTSANAWDALKRCFQVMRKLNVKAQYGFLESGSELSVAIEYFLPVEPLNYDAEFKLAMLLKIARTLTGPGLIPVAVEFRGATPLYAAEMDRYFGAPVQFGAPANRITFNRPIVERPFGQDPTFYAELGRRIEQACAEQAEHSEAALRVRGLVMQSLGEGYGGMKSLAPKLGISSRTLQRKLQQEGTTYQELLDASRKRLCLSYMRAPKRTLEEIAALLGYANMPNFHRAFKRWFGVPPAKFRRRLRGMTAPEPRRRDKLPPPMAHAGLSVDPGQAN
jgi:AraC-like DNA-binding protein